MSAPYRCSQINDYRKKCQLTARCGGFPGFVLLAFAVLGLVLPRTADARGVPFTVGPDGNFGTVQAAIDNCTPGGEYEIWVERDEFSPPRPPENVTIPSDFTSGSITITGGWDSAFASRTNNAHVTSIDGGGAGRAIAVETGGGDVTFDGLTLKNGISTSGGGIAVTPTGDATVTLNNVIVRDNTVSTAGGAYGGGLWAQLTGSERLVISGCIFSGNTAAVVGGSGANAAAGAGFMITASGTATFLVQDSWVQENTASSDSDRKDGAGHFVSVIQNASGEIEGLFVSENNATGANAQVAGSGGYLGVWGDGQLVVRRSAWSVNSDETAGAAEQLRLSAQGNAALLKLTDSAVALGDGDGLEAVASDTSTLQLTNLTVADNPGFGIIATEFDTAQASLFNSIAYGNGTNGAIHNAVQSGTNLIDVDPLFMSPGPPDYNYHLGVGSPGVNAGTNSPPGGLGATDLDGLTRLEEGVVDIGCYEGEGLLFFDGFEGGGTGEWSNTVP